MRPLREPDRAEEHFMATQENRSTGQIRKEIEQKLSPQDLSAAQRYGRELNFHLDEPQSVSRGEALKPTSALRQEHLDEPSAAERYGRQAPVNDQSAEQEQRQEPPEQEV